MSRNSKPSVLKREKEKARAQKQQVKEARRSDARARRSQAEGRGDGEDPDLAGIVPGPQPVAPEFEEPSSEG